MSRPDLTEVALPDLLSFIVDNRGRTCPVVDEGFPLIATNSVIDGSRRVVPKDVRYVDDETYRTWFRAHPEPNDVLFVCKGTPGKVALVPDPVPYCIAQDMVALRANLETADPAYLYYRLSASDVREAIEGLHVGSLIPHFKKGDFDKLRFKVHPLPEQRRISAVLSSLDDLIEHNRAQVEALNQLWRSIVRSGLASGRDQVKLSDLARFVNGRNFTKHASGVGLPVIRTPEVRNGPSASTVRSDIEAADDNVARLGDILFVWSGSLLVDRWAYEPGLVNQHIFKVMPTEGVPTWLVLWSIEELMADFLGVAADKATTMGHIKRADLDRTVAVPPRPDWPALDATVAPLFDLAMDLQAEVIEFSRTRDELLPLLMSGDIRVDETLEVSA
jgi:type I restriction enzyme S subunit